MFPAALFLRASDQEQPVLGRLIPSQRPEINYLLTHRGKWRKESELHWSWAAEIEASTWRSVQQHGESQTHTEGKNTRHRASPVGPVVKNGLAMQGTLVWSLVREDSTCPGATNPKRHNYWDSSLEPASRSYRVKPKLLEPKPCKQRSHCSEKPVGHN